MLSKKDIEKLRQIVEKDYGCKISKEQAEELGMSLLRLTRVALRAQTRIYENKKKHVSFPVREKKPR